MRNPHIDPYSDRTPLRAYGTWLHGDGRGSIDRFHNRYNTPYIALNERWHAYNERLLNLAPVKLTAQRRAAIYNSISETAKYEVGDYTLRT